MTSEGAGDRAQDVGRRHRRKGQPSAETVALLESYRQAMRDELRDVLAEIRGKAPEPGLLPDAAGTVVRPAIAERAKLWDLGIRLGRELGAAIDEPELEAAPPRARARRPRAIDFGGE